MSTAAAPACTIRLAAPDDAAVIAAIYAPIVETTAISFEEVAPDAAEIRRRIEATLGPFPYLVAVGEAGVAGYAYASAYRPRAAYRWSVAVSVYVGEAGRRRGTGAALYRALFAILTRQGYQSAFAGITLPNAASVALHEAVGFRLSGTDPRAGHKFGRWWDVGRFAFAFNPLGDAPEPPRTLQAIGADTVAACLTPAAAR